MSKPLQWVLGISVLIVALTVAGVGYCAAWALQQWGEAAPTATLAKLNTTLDGINPVIAKADIAFGNLADATGDWSDASKQQARDVRALLAASGRTLDAVTEDAHAAKGTLQAFGKTADALTGTAQGATDTLAEGKRTISAAQPLMTSLTRNSDDINAFIRENSPIAHATMVHFGGIATSADSGLADLQWKEHQLLHPDKVKLGFWGTTWATAKYIHQLEPPLF